jgi:hypothetical protein
VSIVFYDELEKRAKKRATIKNILPRKIHCFSDFLKNADTLRTRRAKEKRQIIISK